MGKCEQGRDKNNHITYKILATNSWRSHAKVDILIDRRELERHRDKLKSVHMKFWNENQSTKTLQKSSKCHKPSRLIWIAISFITSCFLKNIFINRYISRYASWPFSMLIFCELTRMVRYITTEKFPLFVS